MEKGFNFYSDGKFYRYSTSIDDSELPGSDGTPALRPIEDPAQMVRGYTVYNCGIMERDADGKIILSTVT